MNLNQISKNVYIPSPPDVPHGQINVLLTIPGVDDSRSSGAVKSAELVLRGPTCMLVCFDELWQCLRFLLSFLSSPLPSFLPSFLFFPFYFLASFFLSRVYAAQPFFLI